MKLDYFVACFIGSFVAGIVNAAIDNAIRRRR